MAARHVFLQPGLIKLDSLGRHILVEFFGCDPSKLDSVPGVEASLNEAVVASGATAVSSAFHKFNPVGASGVIVLEESHFSIHTWPETGYASADFYTCGDCDPFAGIDVLGERLGAESYELMYVQRGRHVAGESSMKVMEHRSVENVRKSKAG